MLFLSPVCNDQTFDANGDPLTGGEIETYLSGSSTPAATYTDDGGGTPHSYPIVLNSLGYPTAGPIWLTGGISYKFIIKNAAGSTLRTIDDISGVNDASVSQSQWVQSGFVPTYISATSFSVPGDQTAILQINRRVETTNTSGLVYSTISNSVFAAGITTVTLVNDSTTLDAGLSAVAYAVLSADNPSIPAIYAKTVDVQTAIQTQQYTAFTTAGTTTAYTLTPVPAISALAANQRFRVKFNAANTTATPTLAISGMAATALKLYDGAGVKQDPAIGQIAANLLVDVEYDGTDMVLLNIPKSRIGTLQAATSGNSKVFPIPAWATQITMSIIGLSTNGTGQLFARLGDAGGIENSGYIGASESTSISTGFVLTSTGTAAAGVYSGLIIFTLVDPATNSWSMSSAIARSDTPAVFTSAGYKSLSGILTQVAVETPDTFDLGSCNVRYN